ncbi:MAG TPA: hypothetical protein VD996_12460 [Chitinophagaceae bacterium]|nr:hypothetical protein [Chitinophagaceae bacterium]
MFIVFLVLCCNDVTAQQWNSIYTDSSGFSIDTATVGGRKYLVYISGQEFRLVNIKGEVLLKRTDYFTNTFFKDFNGDGYRDIWLAHSGNTITHSLFLYHPGEKRFREVKGFRAFPEAKKIPGTPYYYSYRKSGCADMNWDSDLFYITNYRAVRVGNISGRQCEDNEVKDGIYIYKVREGKVSLFQTLSIELAWQDKDLKWGFIKKYWMRNYKLFL